MKDGEIKKTGNSRFMRSLNMPDTYEEFKALLESGIFPIDFNGINPDGWKTIPDWLNKANLLSDATCDVLGIPRTSVPDDAIKLISRQATETIVGGVKARKAEVINSINEIGIDSTTGKLYSNAFTIPSLNQATPAEINLLSMNGTAKSYWSIGDLTAPITLTTGERITLQLADFNHDDLVNGGKAGITFVMKDCFDNLERMNSRNSNSGTWAKSDIRNRMSIYLNQFPIEWRKIIKQVKKTTKSRDASNKITNDYLWLLSCEEVNVGGAYIPNDMNAPENEGEVYPLFTDDVSRIKRRRYDTSDWWLRSPLVQSLYYFTIIEDDGDVDDSSANDSNGIVLGLCI